MHTILLILYCSVMIEYNNPIRFDLDNLDIKIDTVYCKQNQYSDFLLKELGKNAKDMNDMQRSDYVVKMLAVPDSSFLKDEDFIIFVNYLQGKRSEEYSEGIGYYLMRIYKEYIPKINEVEKCVDLLPLKMKEEALKGLCEVLFFEYSIEESINDTIKRCEIYKELPILKKYEKMTEEIAHQAGYVLVDK